jgi:hypothetical protein
MRVIAVAASAAAVLGGGSFALASDAAPAAGAVTTTYYACVVTNGSDRFFPWHSLWKTSTNPVNCPNGSFSINWNQAGPQGPKGDTGATGATGATGPQGPPGTFGSIHTFNLSADLPNNVADTLAVKCDSGAPIGGGMAVSQTVVGVYTVSDRPQPDSGTPTSWEVTIANTSGLDLTMTVYVVCASPAGSSSAAAQAQGAHIVRQFQAKIKNAKG